MAANSNLALIGTSYISENTLQIKIIENCEDINNERLMRKILQKKKNIKNITKDNILKTWHKI